VAVSLLSVFALATFRVWQPDWPRPRPAPTTPLARFADNNTAMGLVLIGGGCFLLFMFLGDHSYVNSLGFAAMAFVTGALTLKSPAASKMDERQKAAMRAFTRVGLPFTAAYMFGRFALGFIAPWPAILAADLSFALMATLAAIWYYSQLKHS
jgi:hypothetical protein